MSLEDLSKEDVLWAHEMEIGHAKAEIERLEAENAALCERLEKAVELKAKVGDTIYMPWVWAGGSGIAVLEVLYIQMFADELEYNTDFEADDLAYAAFYKFGNFGRMILARLFLLRVKPPKPVLRS